ncbi:hypothetical protein EVAR_9199_1 [Eumeta japonica]|uniref:BED-type domain-containing protein n=1 Tax=Eumeta variegata TaxID=151549 RepID=A0A4C1WQB5_EUMVA|nr:hypothetical protein EVAR_9199_1 [Eumeta japonica]
MAVRIATGIVAHIGGSEGFAIGCRSRHNFTRNIGRRFLLYKAINFVPGPRSGKGKKRRSWIWSYFVKGTDMCVCKICATELKNNKNSTGNLIRHIKLKHQNIYKTLRLETDALTLENLDINPEAVQDPLAESSEAHKNSGVVDYYKNAVHELDIQCYDEDGNDISNENMKIIGDDKEWVWQLVSNEPEEESYKCFMCDQNFDKTLDHEKDLTKIYDHMNSDHGVISAVQIISDEGVTDTSLSNDECKELNKDNEISVQLEIQEDIEIEDSNLEMANIKIIMEKTENH